MGLCGEIDNVDKAKIYGVIPYISPEVLRGKPYTQAADIYSLGIIMIMMMMMMIGIMTVTTLMIAKQNLWRNNQLLIHKLFIHLDYLILLQKFFLILSV